MLSVTPMRGAGYFKDLERDSQESLKAAAAKGYYEKGVDAGEPPGIVVGPGAPDLGLKVGMQMDDRLLDRTWTKNLFPDSGAPIGSPHRNYAGPAENLAKEARKRGIGLPPDLAPAAVRAAVAGEVRQAGKNRVERDVIARIGELVDADEFKDLKRHADRQQRNNVPLYDLTFSAPKEWSVLRTAFLKVGDVESARHVAEAWCDDGFNTVLEVGMAEANVTREGYHGKKVAGWSAGRYVDGGGWTVAKYPHHYSREGDPHLHVHGGLLNRTKTPDGKWLSIDGTALERAKKLSQNLWRSVRWWWRGRGFRFGLICLGGSGVG